MCGRLGWLRVQVGALCEACLARQDQQRETALVGFAARRGEPVEAAIDAADLRPKFRQTPAQHRCVGVGCSHHVGERVAKRLHHLAVLAAVEEAALGIDVLFVLKADRQRVSNVQVQLRPYRSFGWAELRVGEACEGAQLTSQFLDVAVAPKRGAIGRGR